MSLSLQDLEEFKYKRDNYFISELDALIKEAFNNYASYVIIPSHFDELLDTIMAHYKRQGFIVEFDTCILDYVIKGW